MNEAVGPSKTHNVIMGGSDEDLDDTCAKDTLMDYANTLPAFNADREVDEMTPRRFPRTRTPKHCTT